MPISEALKEIVRPFYLRWLYFPLFPSRRPEYFQACWERPFCELSAENVAKWIGPGREPDLLFLPMTDWHTRIQRTQQLARAFANLGHRCFYVNPHLGREFPETPLGNRPHRIAVLGPRLFELHISLPREPVFHHRLPRPSETRILVAALELLTRAAGTRRLAQIVSLPFWFDAACELRKRHGYPIVYDCHDLLGAFQGMAAEIVKREAGLLRSCDVAVFSARQLMERKAAELPALCEKAVLARNGVDFSHFTWDPARNESSRKDGKTIGYAGSLSYWFDTEAVRRAAARRPEWKFVLIGRIEDERILKLRELKNIELPGEVPYAELPRRLAEFDVGLIPFLRTDLTLSTNPIKLYEYFRFGMPVVSTRLPEVEAFGDLVRVGDTPEDFAAQVERAAAEQDPSLRERRIAVARQETWTSRAELILRAIEARSAPPDPASRGVP